MADSGLRRAPGAFAVFALAFGYFALFVHYGFNLDDEGTLLAQFYRTYLGEIPYRDFHMGYTPAGHYLQARLFQAFGVSVVPLRIALALCHASCAALLYAIGRRTTSAAFAVLPPLAYATMLPFYPGEFASFNIPYPAWYVTLCWLAGLWTLLRFVESKHLGWVAQSGVLAGICFAFKPNVGLFQLAGAGLVLLIALEPPPWPQARRLDEMCWWLLAFGIAAGLSFVFASQASARDLRIFLLPIGIVLLTLVVRRGLGRSGVMPARSITAAVLILGVATLAVILPWTITFLKVLGTQRFARQILFIGTGFEQYYYVPFHLATAFDRAMVLAALGVLAVGLLVRARIVPPSLVAVAAALAAAVAARSIAHARMPEGLHAAFVSRVEDMSFAATLVIEWAAFVPTLPVLWRRTRTRRELEQVLVFVSALAMYLQLYPRSDFMHLVFAAPLTLVVGAGLAARLAGWFGVSPGWERGVRWATIGAAVALALARVWPNFGAVLRWEDGPAWRTHAALDLERAPITLEVGRAPRLRDVHDTVRFLDANTAPGEAIFPFPAIELLCFLADRPNATRHGYFFPGWPGHEVEAEVVSALRASPPRFVVALHAHQFFFLHAPVYYYSLREFVQGRYRLVRRFGAYAVLARNDIADDELRDEPRDPAAGVAALARRYGARLEGLPDERLQALRELWFERLDFAWEPVVARLVDDDPRVRDAAVWALANAMDDPEVAAEYARALLQGAIPDERHMMVLRRIWAFGDGRVIRPMLELLRPPGDPEEHSIALGALESIGQKLTIRDDWFGLSGGGAAAAAPGLAIPPEAARLLHRRSWWMRLANPEEDPRMRSFLVATLPRLGPVRNGIDALDTTLGASQANLRVTAVAGLLRIDGEGRRADLAQAVLPLVSREPVFAPSLLLTLYRADPHGLARIVLRALDAPYVLDRIDIAWVMSATGDRHFRRAFVQLLHEPLRPLRLAALAGLERIRDPRTRTALLRASMDPDYEVRQFAERALRALPPP